MRAVPGALTELETLSPCDEGCRAQRDRDGRNSGSGTAGKAIDILELLAEDPEGLTSVQASRRLRLDKSNSHRLLTTLRERGLVRRDPRSRLYVLDAHFFVFAWRPNVSPWVVLQACPDTVAYQTGESATCSLLHRASFVCVARSPSSHEFRVAPEVRRRYAWEERFGSPDGSAT